MGQVDTSDLPSMRRIWAAGAINLLIAFFPIWALAAHFMALATDMTGEKFAWPQIDFMSAYPDDVRNGYLLFVLAVVVTNLVLSGIVGAGLGRSLGKAVLGIRYVGASGEKARFASLFLRALLTTLLLLPTLLLGPILGFVFGSKADGSSMAALVLGIGLVAMLTLPLTRAGSGLSWVNRVSGVRPVVVRSGSE
jgi:uncharacterized RDD family membrane protein YckC